jgi:phosphoglycerate dehydrogenase-like enzyme
MTAKITALMNEPEANGDYVAELTMPDGTTSTATISLDVARVITVTLQQAIAEQWAKTSRGTFLVFRVNSAMVGSNELGQTVMQMSDEWLVEVQRYIDRVQTSRQTSRTIQ